MRSSTTTPGARELVKAASVELIPLKGIDSTFALIPTDTTVTITCSAKFGLERTLDFCELARDAGLSVVPHLAARQVRDQAELREFAKRACDLGVTDLYVIGGDIAEPRGKYHSAADLLRELADLEHGFHAVGVACYPEGHPSISNDVLMEELHAKQELATYMVSQLCFDQAALVGWLTQVRSLGVTLPLRLGVAGPVSFRKLTELSIRIGVGQSLRYLTKQHGMLRNLVVGSAYRPERLVEGILQAPGADALGIERLHIFSFNQVEATTNWMRGIIGPARS